MNQSLLRILFTLTLFSSFFIISFNPAWSSDDEEEVQAVIIQTYDSQGKHGTSVSLPTGPLVKALKEAGYKNMGELATTNPIRLSRLLGNLSIHTHQGRSTRTSKLLLKRMGRGIDLQIAQALISGAKRQPARRAIQRRTALSLSTRH